MLITFHSEEYGGMRGPFGSHPPSHIRRRGIFNSLRLCLRQHNIEPSLRLCNPAEGKIGDDSYVVS